LATPGLQQLLQPKTKKEDTNMPNYTAYFYTDADWAKIRIEADTPTQALEIAQDIESDNLELLNFQNYDGIEGIEHIEIRAPNGWVAGEWLSDSRRLRLAASEMLQALELALTALNTAPRFSAGATDSYAVAAFCESAIAKAKGGR
jgi:hypothetical protein